MPRLLLSKAQGGKDFRKPSKAWCVGIHWIALAEYSQISTHVPIKNLKNTIVLMTGLVTKFLNPKIEISNLFICLIACSFTL